MRGQFPWDTPDTALRARGVPGRAEHEKGYLKSELNHYGTSVPAICSVARAVAAQHPGLSHDDLVMLAGALWGRRFTNGAWPRPDCSPVSRPPAGRGHRPVERLLRESRTWALAGPLPGSAAGPLAERHPEVGVVPGRWARDQDFSIQRAALLALLVPLRRGDGDFGRFARYADALPDDSEFFVRKAIGWVRRKTARKRPSLVYTWLLPRAGGPRE